MANTIHSALTDIPLSLEETDGPEIQAAKRKSNSLKRFFKSALPSSNTDMATNTTSGAMKTSVFLRFASFNKSDGLDRPGDEKELGASAFKSEASRSQWSLSNYWTLLLKKISKKSPTKEAETNVGVVPQTDVKHVQN